MRQEGKLVRGSGTSETEKGVNNVGWVTEQLGNWLGCVKQLKLLKCHIGLRLVKSVGGTGGGTMVGGSQDRTQ